MYASYPDYSDPDLLDGAPERLREFLDYDRYEPFVELPADLPGASLVTIKQLCRARGITGFSRIAKSGAGKVILDAIVEELRAWKPPDDLDHHIKTAFFKAWFLSGTGSTKAMKLGLLNEPNVLRGLQSFMVRSPSFTDSNGDEWTLTVKFVRQCGLVVRQEKLFLATSADGISIFDIQCSDLNWVDKEYIVPVEIKTRSGESELSFANRQPPFSVLRLNLEELSHSDQATLFKQCVPSHDNRVQLLHHALVYATNMVFFIEASKDSIIRTVLIMFPDDLLIAYEKVLSELAIEHLQWIYSPGVDIPRFTSSELGNVGELFTLEQNLAMWRAAHDLFFENNCAPFGDIGTIVPAVVSYWNATKGGVDSGLSRYLANVHSSPYRVIPFESVLWDRTIMTAFLNAFALSKWDRLSAAQISSCNSFAQLKQISQRDFTLKLFLSEGMKHFRSLADSARNPGAAIQAQADTSSMTRGERVTYYNTQEGKARRSNAASSHGLTHNRVQHKCMVCQEHKVHWSCECCTDMFFCIETIKDHPNHPDRSPERAHLYWTCRDIFHNARFTLPT